MRIVFDGRVLVPGSHHGIARYAAGLLGALSAEPGDHDYTVLTRTDARGETVPEIAALENLGRFRILTGGPTPYSPAELVSLPRLVEAQGADLYYSPTFMPPWRGRTPQVFTILDLIHLENPADYPLSRRVVWKMIITPRARRAGRMMTISRTVAGQMTARLGIDPDRIVIAPPAAGAAFRPRSAERVERILARLGIRPPYLVTAGNPRPHKNLTGAATAFHALARDAWPGDLVMAGAGGMDLPQGPGRVVRVDGVSDDDLAGLYSGAAGAFFCSLAEGFGLPPLEAMSCGCPVAVGDIEIMRELLGPKPETRALLADPADPGDMARALALLVGDAPSARKRAAAALERAAGFTWASAAGRLREAFDAIARGKGRTGGDRGA